MRIAEELGLSQKDRSDLYYALLLKDSGCSSNAARLHQILGANEIQAKSEAKLEDWTKASLPGLRYLIRNVIPDAPLWQRLARIVKVGALRHRTNVELFGARCERGAEIARQIGLSEETALAIRSLDEHWDGSGYPEGLKGQEIPILSRIMNVSQSFDVFCTRSGLRLAVRVVAERSGSWFDPQLVRVLKHLERDTTLWQQMMGLDARALRSGDGARHRHSGHRPSGSTSCAAPLPA